MSISVTLISDNYSPTFISLWITFYRQISLKIELYPPVIVTGSHPLPPFQIQTTVVIPPALLTSLLFPKLLNSRWPQLGCKLFALKYLK